MISCVVMRSKIASVLHLCLSDMWLDVASRTYNKKKCVHKKFRLRAHDVIIMVCSIINIIGRETIRPFNEHENFHFEESYEETDNGLDLGLLPSCTKLHVSFRRSGKV
jgi:hypothetical protein